MRYFSTRDTQKENPVSLKNAVLTGLAPDGGLYLPETWPQLSSEFIENLKTMNFKEIAYEISLALFGDELSKETLQRIVEESYNFEVPIVQIKEQIHCMELFHGPTLAFKDFAARFMSRLMAELKPKEETLTILVATSGDTGGAVGSGFHQVPGFNVLILYPKGQVSHVQRQQLTTMGENVIALEVDANFDQCQRMVKMAFQNEELKQLNLSTANSINIARLLPQTFYYFWAYAQLQTELIISVPSGNLGNVCAGLIAKKMGLPVKHFIIANNENAAVHRFFETGLTPSGDSIPTLSNAMDIALPSNLERMRTIYNDDLDVMKADVKAYVVNDKETVQTMKRVYDDENYMLDPHGAVGYLALEQDLLKHPEDTGLFLETAHPAKFDEVVQKALGEKPAYPESLNSCLSKEAKPTPLAGEFEALKQLLLKPRPPQ